MTMTILTCSLVKKALTCPQDKGAWAVGYVVDEEHTPNANTIKQCVPLRCRAACRSKCSGLASVLGRRCVSVRIIVMRNLGCCFLDESACGGCLRFAEVQLRCIERGREARQPLPVVFSIGFVLVFSLSRIFLFIVRCSVGCRGRGHVRGSCRLSESATCDVICHDIPFRTVFCRSELGRSLLRSSSLLDLSSSK